MKKTVKLVQHQRKDNGADIQINSKDFPSVREGDVLEVYHPEDEFSRLLVQVSKLEDCSQLKAETVSIETSIATAFQLRAYKDVYVTQINPKHVALDLVELLYKDQYYSRSDMWRMRKRLVGKCVYLNKKIEHADMRATVNEMWSKGDKVTCGVILENTRIVFRSSTAVVQIFIQMSTEMWDFDINGDLYFEKAVNGFLTDLFAKWKEQNCCHDVSIVLFSRTFYNAQSLDDFPAAVKECLQVDNQGRIYEDFYRVVIQNERYEEWTNTIKLLRKYFHHYKDRVILYHHHCGLKMPPAWNSNAAQGNFLETLNMSLNLFENYYLDRNFDRTGKVSVVITPGPGVFEVDRELTNITKQRTIDCDTPAETKPLSEAELEEEHDRIISNIQSLTRKYAAPESASSTSHTWSSRRSREASNWEAVREELQYSLLVRQGVPLEQKCCQCQSEYVSVRCEDCNFSYYCALCDSDRHAWEPFHCRQFVVSGGERFDYVGPCTELEEGDQGEVHQRYKEKYLNNILVMPDRCPGCDGESTVTLKTWGTCIVVTMKGRFDIFLPQLQCSQCEYVKKPGISEIVRIGFWPGNSNITPGMYIFDEELFFLFDHLKKEKPGLSVRAWLSTLEYTSIMKNRHGKISHKVFSESLREWQRCQFYLGTVQGVDLMKCPACFHGMHGCHCDGNRKVYRFKGHNQSTEENYYKDVFIASDERVDEFVKTVKGTLVKVDNDQCGQTHWQAARTSSKSMKHLAETGLVVACCRHNVLLKAVNMFQGEIFAYPLFIQQELALQHEIKFFCQDVICKYWPWLSRIKERLNQTSFAEATTKAASMQPFLSVMHAKSHDWTCQILWGGKWQEGAAKTTGEEMEQCNSYLSTTGSTTKNMSKSSREEQLTIHALHWNSQKMKTLPHMLKRWLLKARDQCLAHAKELDEMRSTELPGQTVSKEDIKQWEHDVRQAAKDAVRRTELERGDIESLFILHHSHSVASQLSSYTSTASEALGIVTGTMGLVKTTSSHVKSDRPHKLNELKERLTATSSKTLHELLDEGKETATMRTVVQLQKRIEILQTSINIRHHNIQRIGDSGTHRHRLRRKVVQEKKQLDGLVFDYNQTLTLMRCPIEPVTEAMKSTGEWPWITGTNDNIPFHVKRNFVEKQMEIDRNNEQVQLVEKEVVAMVDFYNHQLQATEERLTLAKQFLESCTKDMESTWRGHLALLSSRKQDIFLQLGMIGQIFNIELENGVDEEEDDDDDDGERDDHENISSDDDDDDDDEDEDDKDYI